MQGSTQHAAHGWRDTPLGWLEPAGLEPVGPKILEPFAATHKFPAS